MPDPIPIYRIVRAGVPKITRARVGKVVRVIAPDIEVTAPGTAVDFTAADPATDHVAEAPALTFTPDGDPC